jgi:hypothetical protein
MGCVTLHRNSAAIPASRFLPLRNSLRPSGYSILSTALLEMKSRFAHHEPVGAGFMVSVVGDQ